MNPANPTFWAKTTAAGIPGISVVDHCINVGCVAEALITRLPARVSALLPLGAAGLAALHDIGKVTLGFQAKSIRWLIDVGLLDAAKAENWPELSVSDHALVSQVFLQNYWRGSPLQLWAVAIGAHHGRPKGRPARLNRPEVRAAWATEHRQLALQEILRPFGPLPERPPSPELVPYHADLWFFAGLVTVADWIGSNEDFFSPDRGIPVELARQQAEAAVRRIGWPGGRLRQTSFAEAFSRDGQPEFKPNALQQSVSEAAMRPGVMVVEGPMGCGKTEAALAAAQSLISSGHHHGLYFALPTQITSGRIHERVGRFLRATLADPAQFRLAHGNAWLQDDFDLRIAAAYPANSDSEREETAGHVREARSWFASSKHALLAPYGVGTIDQALQAVVAVKHFFVRRFALAGKVVILDEVHSYDLYTGTLVTALVRELLSLRCSVIILSATLTAARRRELLLAAGVPEPPVSDAYPLVTWAEPGSAAHQVSPPPPRRREVNLRTSVLPEAEIIQELIRLAEDGQHVLWIRNTVIEAQQAFRAAAASLREGDIRIGLLHSRFPFQRRAELETEWLERLGPARPRDGGGSILVATQVVEQSVDIDLDFIVSDLAPTDMLLQRMGRLWRHDRARRATVPQFWINLPRFDESMNAVALSRAIGRSGRVYAPYVLLRTAGVFANRHVLVIPDDLRTVIEATYAPPQIDEPEPMRELRHDLERERESLAAHAEAITRVFSLPMLADDEGVLTRRAGAPTLNVVLIRKVVPSDGRTVRLTGLDGATLEVSEYQWGLPAARNLHQWLVRIPRWMVPASPGKPRWLSLHVPGAVGCAEVGSDGRCIFGDQLSAVVYDRRLGVFSERPSVPTPQWNDDDEFDS